METMSLRASRRDVLGKKVKSLRRKGLVPANLFGHDMSSIPLQLDRREAVNVLRGAGTHALVSLRVDDQPPRTVLVRDFSLDPRSGRLIHVDLYQVGMKEKLHAKVPLAFEGEAPAVSTAGGVLVRGADEVEIECLPKDLPPAIIVDLSSLTELDESIHVRDLALPPGVKILTEPDEVIARIAAPRAERVEEELAAPGVSSAEEEVAPVEETPTEEGQ